MFLGRYSDARATFTTALAEARAISFAPDVGGALHGLISIDMVERAYADARARSEEAIAIFTRLGEHFFLSGTHALCAIALLLADSGAPERSAELCALIEGDTNVRNNLWAQDVILRELAAIVAGLPPEIAAAAQERGRARDLWATARELLAELEAAGWG